jgi:adenine-specific DNA-methyltransferase
MLAKAWNAQQPQLPFAARWSDHDEASDAALRVLGSHGVEMVFESLLKPEQANSAPPSLELMIRHASGRIFQEAHYVAIAPLQQQLFFDGQVEVAGPESKTLGAFFTPTPLVRTLVERALADLDLQRPLLSIFDPACGSGEFLREAVRQLGMRGYTGEIRVVGYDISEAACLMARFGLAAEAVKAIPRTTIEIIHRDAMDLQPWITAVDVCLMNPPFVSWPDMTKEQQASVVKHLGELRQNRPDMATTFLRRAIECLGAQGVVGAVLPASFLDGSSAQPLRSFVAETMSLELAARLGNQAVFADVTVDPALVIARRRRDTDPRAALMLWADHKPGSSDMALRSLRQQERTTQVGCLRDTPQFSIYTVPEETLSTSWAPRPYRSARLVSALAGKSAVGRIYSVKQGTLTGLNAVFVLGNGELSTLPKAERRYFRRAVLNDSIANGRLASTSWVFYPHGDDLSELATEDDVQRELRTFYRTRLLPYREALIRRWGITEANWWTLSKYRDWQVARRPKIVSTYFGDAGSFALDREGDHVVVQGYAWLPKQGSLTEKHLLATVATLSARITSVLLAGVSNNLGGGQWNLSKRFIENMPVVDPTAMPDDILNTLAAFGERLADGTTVDAEELNRLARIALGLSADDATE